MPAENTVVMKSSNPDDVVVPVLCENLIDGTIQKWV